MSILKLLEQSMQKSAIQYQIESLPESMKIHEVANHLAERSQNLIRLVVLKDDSGLLLVALPYDSLLDIQALSQQNKMEYQVVAEEKVQRYFKNCMPGCFPPFPEIFRLRLLIDRSVLDLQEVLMQSGDSALLVRLDKVNANLVYQGCESLDCVLSKKELFSGRNKAVSDGELDISFLPVRLKQRIDETFDLPAMPDIAQGIMKLRVDPGADVHKLADIVCRDPSIAAQVISWASSPYYSYQGKIDSVETAISRVLGYELVINLALGISIGKSFKIPEEGPLGLHNFWKQAIYTANLAEKLCRAMPVKQRPKRGLIYLSGLLHNFGHLLLGHVFPPQFKLVNTMLEANPHIPVEDIEFYILGVTHEEIGAWLMKNWHMPDELIVAVRHHHQEEFWSKHSTYSNIVLVANRLLHRLHIGDSVDSTIPHTTLELLSLDEAKVEMALEAIELDADNLNGMVKQLVA